MNTRGKLCQQYQLPLFWGLSLGVGWLLTMALRTVPATPVRLPLLALLVLLLLFFPVHLGEENGGTTLSGPVRDQAELHGLLAKIRDLNLTLLAVKQAEVATE